MTVHIGNIGLLWLSFEFRIGELRIYDLPICICLSGLSCRLHFATITTKAR